MWSGAWGIVALLALAGCAAPSGPGASPAPSSAPEPSSLATTPDTTPAPPPAPCPGSREGLKLLDPNHTVVAIQTQMGCLVAELHDDRAPRTVAHFLRHVQEGYYDATHCYRIHRGFVTQCGGAYAGKASPYPPVRNEAEASGLRNERYTLAMAREDDPDSATTEFFVNAADNCHLDDPAVSKCPRQVAGAGYAVFGVVVAGQDVADRLNGQHNAIVPLVTIQVLAPGADPPAESLL